MIRSKYHMEIKDEVIKSDDKFKVLVPVRIQDRYPNLYIDIRETLNKGEVFDIPGAELKIFKTDEGKISVYNMLDSIYVVKDAEISDLLTICNEIKNDAVSYVIRYVYDVANQCEPMLLENKNIQDERAIIYHLANPGDFAEKTNEQKTELLYSLINFANENKIKLNKINDVTENSLSMVIDEIISAQIPKNKEFERNLCGYIVKSSLGMQPPFNISIPLQYQNNSLDLRRQIHVLEKIDLVSHEIRNSIIKDLNRKKYDLRLEKINDYDKVPDIEKNIKELENSLVELKDMQSLLYSNLKEFMNGVDDNIINRIATHTTEVVSCLTVNQLTIKEVLKKLPNMKNNDNINEEIQRGFNAARKIPYLIKKFNQQMKMFEYEKTQESIEKYIVNEKDFFQAYSKEPYITLLELQEKGEKSLQGISKNDLMYIANSEYIKQNFSRFLKQGKEKFLEKTTYRLSQIEDAKSKNGVFAEIAFCENVLSEKIFSDGEIVSIKEANEIIQKFEKIIREQKKEYEKNGKGEFPNAECIITVFAPTLENTKENKPYYQLSDTKMCAVSYRYEIGSGENKNFKELIQETLEEYLNATNDINEKKKIQNYAVSVDKALKEKSSIKKKNNQLKKKILKNIDVLKKKKWRNLRVNKDGREKNNINIKKEEDLVAREILQKNKKDGTLKEKQKKNYMLSFKTNY